MALNYGIYGSRHRNWGGSTVRNDWLRHYGIFKQEIYSAILLHCLTNIIADRIQIEQSDRRKHKYKVNISTAVTNMRLWLRKLIGTAELMKRIKKYLAPVRPDRKYQRNMKPKSVVPFNTKAS